MGEIITGIQTVKGIDRPYDTPEGATELMKHIEFNFQQKIEYGRNAYTEIWNLLPEHVKKSKNKVEQRKYIETYFIISESTNQIINTDKETLDKGSNVIEDIRKSIAS